MSFALVFMSPFIRPAATSASLVFTPFLIRTAALALAPAFAFVFLFTTTFIR